MRAPCYPLSCNPMVGQACPVGTAPCFSAYGMDGASSFHRRFIGAVFGQKGGNAGIVFKTLTHICESREWIFHFSTIVLRPLHVESRLDMVSPSVQALWEREGMKWEL